MDKNRIEAEIRLLEMDLRNPKGAGRMRPCGTWAYPKVRARIARELKRKKEELDRL